MVTVYMKKEYNIKDTVWIHIGERKLTEGRVVEIIDLEHLDEGHDPSNELYIIELKTGIDDIYEVRTFEQISPDAQGPITLFRKHKDELVQGNRLLKKIGMPLPDSVAIYEPTPDEIHAAMERSQQATQHTPLNTKPKSNLKYVKRKPRVK
jgi:hypothetical protein